MVTADAAYATGEDIVQRNAKTVLDMSDMDYLSSAGLRVLLRLNKLAKKNGKAFTLAGPSGIVKSVLEDSGMDALFAVWNSLDEAE
jgi:anti-anti-sigma factor